MKELRVGKIDYANVLPLYDSLEESFSGEALKLIPANSHEFEPANARGGNRCQPDILFFLW